VKFLSYMSEYLYVKTTSGKGRGVFTNTALKKNQVIEIAPVIVLTEEDRKLIDQTLLHDYIFEWGSEKNLCCMALGYVPLYNHSYESNCEYEMNFSKQVISIKTIRPIKEEEELFINYNGDWNNKKPIWFEVK
jgi:SET domain-containing protein